MTTLKHRRGPPRSLFDQVVAITGGARGIGHATARALANQGARVAIGDLDGDLAEQVAAELGGDAFGVGVDVTDNAGIGKSHRLGRDAEHRTGSPPGASRGAAGPSRHCEIPASSP